MLHLIPRRLHRLGLRAAYRVRNLLRRVFKPRLRGVSMVLRDDGGRVLLVRHSYGPDEWCLPGGGCGRHEVPEDTARREVLEELGVRIDRLEKLATHEETLAGAPHTAYIFAARLLGDPVPDGREILEARLFAPDALPTGLSALTTIRLGYWLEANREPHP